MTQGEQLQTVQGLMVFLAVGANGLEEVLGRGARPSPTAPDAPRGRKADGRGQGDRRTCQRRSTRLGRDVQDRDALALRALQDAPDGRADRNGRRRQCASSTSVFDNCMVRSRCSATATRKSCRFAI